MLEESADCDSLEWSCMKLDPPETILLIGIFNSPEIDEEKVLSDSTNSLDDDGDILCVVVVRLVFEPLSLPLVTSFIGIFGKGNTVSSKTTFVDTNILFEYGWYNIYAL